MKHISATFFFIVIITTGWFACKTYCPDPWKESKPFQQWCRAVFRSDSGYVSTSQNAVFQQILLERDSSMFYGGYIEFLRADADSFEHKLASLDTFPRDSPGGKYFLATRGGQRHYVACLLIGNDFGGYPYVFDISEKDGVFRLESWKDYQHGLHACCWHGNMSGFYRVGPWFLVNTCNTGSGYCANKAHLLFFPLLSKIDIVEEKAIIPLGSFQWFFEKDDQSVEGFEGKLIDGGDVLYCDYHNYLESSHGEEATVIVRQSDFRAVFKVDTALRQVILLNKEDVAKQEFGDYIIPE